MNWFIQIVRWSSGVHPVIHIYIHINIQLDRKQNLSITQNKAERSFYLVYLVFFDSQNIVNCLWWFCDLVDELGTLFIYYNYWSSDSVMFTLLKLAQWYLNLLCYFRVAYIDLLFDIWTWSQVEFSYAKFIPPKIICLCQVCNHFIEINWWLYINLTLALPDTWLHLNLI